jgi:hypothetical protein
MGIQHRLLLDNDKANGYHSVELLMAADGRYVFDGWGAVRLIPG